MLDQAAVHNAILDALVRYMPETVAKEVTKALARGQIPHTFVLYEVSK